jgi:hypothetical protein
MAEPPPSQTALDFPADDPAEGPVVRHFCDWAEPLLPAAARLLLDHYRDAEGESARMEDAVVVLPGARAGRRLKELLLEAASESDIRLVPPRTVTVKVLPELLYEPDRPFAPELVRKLIWAEALQAADRARLSTLFSLLPEAGEEGAGLAAWMPLARELASLARTVAAGGHRFADVAEACAGTPLFDDAARWRVLARIQDDVERRLGRMGWADRDLVRCEVATGSGELTPGHRGDVWLVGVAEVTGVLHRMLERVQVGVLHAVVHAPSSRAGDFDGLGCIRPCVWSAPERHLPLSDRQVHVVDHPGDQADAVIRILADLDGAYSSEAIALGVPDPQVVPALEERMERSGVAVRDAAGRPLSRTGPYRLLQAAAEFVADRRYDSLAALVRHPDLAPWLGEPGVEPRLERNRELGWLSALDRWYGRHLPSRMVAPYPGTDPEKGSDEGRLVALLMSRLDDLLRPLGDTRRLTEWPGPVLALLAAVYRLHQVSSTTLRGRSLTRALGRLKEAAETFTRLPSTLSFPCDGTCFLRLLLQECADGRIPSTPDEDAVEMLGWLELHLDDTPVTVVTGVNEGSLPESVRGDVFLPDSLRSLLGLEDNRQRYARDLYRLTAMLASREVLHLVAGRRSAGGDPLRPSRLLFAADDDTVTRRVRRFFGTEGDEVAHGPVSGERAGPPLALDPPPLGEPAFRLPPEPVLDPRDVVRTVSVTEFRQLLDDPWSWALGRLHRPETENDHLVEMDGAVFGSLAHEVLEAFGEEEEKRHARGERLDGPEAVWQALEAELDRRVDYRFGPRAARARVAVRVQVEQLRARLRAFAAWHADWIDQGWRVQAVELSTPKDGGIPFEWGGGGGTVGLKARIDRVDFHPETGRWAVFDYKTGDRGHDPEKTHRKGSAEAKEWVDLQLPLYHWLLPRLVGSGSPAGAPGDLDEAPDPDRVEVGFILLPRSLDEVGASMAEWDVHVLAQGVQRARDLLAEHLTGPVGFRKQRVPRWADPEMEALTGRSVLGLPLEDDEGESA